MRSCPVTNKSLSKVGMCELHVIAVLIIENFRRFPVRAPTNSRFTQSSSGKPRCIIDATASLRNKPKKRKIR